MEFKQVDIELLEKELKGQYTKFTLLKEEEKKFEKTYLSDITALWVVEDTIFQFRSLMANDSKYEDKLNKKYRIIGLINGIDSLNGPNYIEKLIYISSVEIMRRYLDLDDFSTRDLLITMILNQRKQDIIERCIYYNYLVSIDNYNKSENKEE